jgi:hypothetical protein
MSGVSAFGEPVRIGTIVLSFFLIFSVPATPVSERSEDPEKSAATRSSTRPPQNFHTTVTQSFRSQTFKLMNT